MKLRPLIIAAIAVSVVTSCMPTVTNTPGGTNNTTVYYTPGANIGGVCVAINVTQQQEIPFVGTVDVQIPAAIAVFYNGTDYTTFQNAGTVQASDPSSNRTLNSQTNNSYVYEDYQSTSFTEWTPSITWNISGSGSVTAFSHTNNAGMPSVNGVTIPDGYSITKSSGATINLGTNIYADTLYVNIASTGNTSVTKRIAAQGGINSVSFTAGELSVLENSNQAIIQLAPCNFNVANYNSKDYVFINEAVYNRTGVTLQ